MVRSLAVGFGMVTALAVAGSLTPVGQGVLGQRHFTEQSVPVSSIQDKPAAIPGPAQALVAPPAAPAPTQVAPPTGSPAPRRPQAAAAPRGTQPPQASRPVQPQAQPQGGPGGIAGIANILLNLPQVLDQTRVGPSHGSDSWSGSDSGGPHKKKRHAQDDRKGDEPQDKQ